MKKRVLSLTLALVLSISLVSCGKTSSLDSSSAESAVIGQVGDFDVTMEMYRYVALSYRADYEDGRDDVWLGDEGAKRIDEMNRRIDETLVTLYTTAAMCKDYGIGIDDGYITDAVDAKMEEIYQAYGDNEAYLAEITPYYMNDAVYRFFVRNEILAEELVRKMVENGEIAAYDESFPAIAAGDAFVRVRQILIQPGDSRADASCLELAEALLERIENGEDFDSLVAEYSEDLSMFGNLDGYYLSRGSFYPEFEDACFSLAVGEVSGIVKTDAGYSIIKRYEKEDEYLSTHTEELYDTYTDGLYNLALEAKESTLSFTKNEKGEAYSPFNLEPIEIGG